MSRENEFTRLKKTHGGLVPSRVARTKLLNKNDYDDAEQEAWLAIWLALPEGGPDNEAAFIRSVADDALNDLVDKQQAKKRRRTEEPLVDEGSSHTLHAAYVIEPVVERALEREDTADALASLGACLRADLRRVLDDCLALDIDDVDTCDHRERQELLRALRRELGLPVQYPADAHVPDIHAHLFDVVDHIEATRALTLETATCASDPNPTNESPSQPRHAPTAGATPKLSGSAPTLATSSPRLRNASARYRRLAAFRSRATKGPGTIRAMPFAPPKSRGRHRLPTIVRRKRSSGDGA